MGLEENYYKELQDLISQEAKSKILYDFLNWENDKK